MFLCSFLSIYLSTITLNTILLVPYDIAAAAAKVFRRPRPGLGLQYRLIESPEESLHVCTEYMYHIISYFCLDGGTSSLIWCLDRAPGNPVLNRERGHELNHFATLPYTGILQRMQKRTILSQNKGNLPCPYLFIFIFNTGSCKS